MRELYPISTNISLISGFGSVQFYTLSSTPIVKKLFLYTLPPRPILKEPVNLGQIYSNSKLLGASKKIVIQVLTCNCSMLLVLVFDIICMNLVIVFITSQLFSFVKV